MLSLISLDRKFSSINNAWDFTFLFSYKSFSLLQVGLYSFAKNNISSLLLVNVQKSENFTKKINNCTFCSKTQAQKHAAGESTFCSLGGPLRAVEFTALITAVPWPSSAILL
jgi:hypothetical protein